LQKNANYYYRTILLHLKCRKIIAQSSWVVLRYGRERSWRQNLRDYFDDVYIVYSYSIQA